LNRSVSPISFADFWFNKIVRQIALQVWPRTDPNDPEDNEEELNIEDQIAKEISSLKRPQTERLIGKHIHFVD
jgi:hypothetical protein